MANTLRFKRGLASGLPTGAAGEPLFTTDTFDLYIGNGTGNTRFQKYIASGTTSQILLGNGSLYSFPLAISSPSNGQVLKYNGTSWVNDSDAGITGSGSAGQVAYFTGATTQAGSNNLFWDNTNVRLGIGTNTPARTLDVRTTGLTILNLNGGTSTNQGSSIYIQNGNFCIGDVSSFLGGTPNANFGMYTSSAPFIFYIGATSERARFHATGNFGIGTGASDSGQRLQVVGTGYFSDSVGIGSTSLTGYSLRVTKGITGSTISYGIASDGAIQSGVTNKAFLNVTSASTAASNFNINDINHYAAFGQTTFSNVTAGGTVSNQFGFFVDSSLTGATTNYGFYGSLAAATGRWNLYMGGTANNFISGSLGIGSTTLTARNLRVSKTMTGAVDAFAISQDGVVQSDVTASANGYYSVINTQAAAFTLTNYRHFIAVGGSIGASSAVTNQYGYFVDSSLTQATNNYGFWGNIASGTGRWNLYMNGTANNYLAGDTQIGSSTISAGNEKLQVTGTARFTDTIKLKNGTTSSLALTFNAATTTGIYNFDDGVGANMILQASGQDNQLVLHRTGNVLIGSGTNSGEKLQVTGTMKVTGATSIGGVLTTGAIVSSAVGGVGGQEGLRIYNNNAYISFFNSANTTRSAYVQGNTSDLTLATSLSTPILFYTNATEKMRLDASGNLGLGTTPSAWGSGLRAIQASTASVMGDGGAAYFSSNWYYNAGNKYIGNGFATSYQQYSGQHVWFTSANNTSGAGATATFTQAMTLDASGNLGIGTASPSQILNLVKNQNAATQLLISNSDTTNSSSRASALLTSGTVNMRMDAIGTLGGYVGTTSNHDVNFWANSQSYMKLTSVGRLIIANVGTDTGELLQVNGTAKITGNLTVDTNTLFVDATNNRVGIGTTTPSDTLHVVGNILATGGGAFEIMNSSLANVTFVRATGGGTNVMSTASWGNNIAIGTETAHDLILASNNTERMRLSSNGFLQHTNATNPTASVVDSYLQYSNDVTAGNAAPHFRTENGAVIKLYQETTAVGNSIISLGGGNAVLDDTTFDGYTLRQLVRALRNQGILQ